MEKITNWTEIPRPDRKILFEYLGYVEQRIVVYSIKDYSSLRAAAYAGAGTPRIEYR